MQAYEPVFLGRALHHISTEVSFKLDRGQITHTIQAEVLLATYFFRNTRFLESEYHLKGAVSLVIAYDFHKIRSCQIGSSTLIGVSDNLEKYPLPPRDVLEEGERINGFWTVFCLERNFSIALRCACKAFGPLEDVCTNIDTPWPVELNDYLTVCSHVAFYP